MTTRGRMEPGPTGVISLVLIAGCFIAAAITLDVATKAEAYAKAHTIVKTKIEWRTRIEYRPAEEVAIIGKERCGAYGGLLGYYVGLFQDSDYEVACRDRKTIFTAHGGQRLSP